MTLQVAAELGAKSARGNDVLTPEEQEIAASSFVDEVPDSNAASPDEQPWHFKGLPGSAVRHDWVGDKEHSPAKQYEVHNRQQEGSGASLDQLRHSYRHGRLQHGGNGSRTSSVAEGSAELQAI